MVASEKTATNEANETVTIKTSDAMADFLEAHGIRHAFGIIGAGNAHLFDSILRKGYTEIICVHHEQAACMSAIAYYRTHGQMPVVIVTTGAGSTNAVTGVVSAWLDSIPCLIISGNENSKYTSPSNPLRGWGVQGYDSSGMVSTVTKYSERVLDPKDTLMVLEIALSHATTGRPGPSWVDIPMNIQATPMLRKDFKPFQPKTAATSSSFLPSHDREGASQVISGEAPSRSRPGKKAVDNSLNAKHGAEQVLKAFQSAQRPVIWLGHGIRLAQAVELIEPLINGLQSPVLVSWAGIDMVDADHPLVFGRAGVYGQRAANLVLQNCDFLLAIGTRLAIPQIGYDLSELTRMASIAMVDIDATEIDKLGDKITIPVLADAGDFMRELMTQVSAVTLDSNTPWLQQCNTYKEKYPSVGPEHNDMEGFINSYPFMERLAKHFKSDQIVVTDMGTALLSGHQVLAMKKGQRLMTSTGLGEMGFGLPAAIGASFANNKGEVLCLNCDGGMMLNLQELQTIVHHELPIKIFVFNNDGYLMIKHTQKALFAGRYAGTDKKSGISCPDFSALAKAFGMPAFTIKTWEEFDKVIPQVQAHQGPLICEVFTHPEQLFVPKLSLALQPDGTIVSPPLEDLSPLLPRDELRKDMIIGIHPKSEKLSV